MDTLKQIFSIANIINSIFAGIFTSIIIWFYFLLRTNRLKHQNYTILFTNLYTFLITLNMARKFDDIIFPIINRIQKKIDRFKNRDKLDIEWLFDDLISDFKILKVKCEIIERKIRESADFLKNIDMALISKKIQSKVLEMVGDIFCLNALETNLGHVIEIEEEYNIRKRTVLSIQNVMKKKIAEINKKMAMIKNESKDEMLKLMTDRSKLIDEEIASIKKQLRDIITLSQNTLYDLRIYSDERKKQIIEIKDDIKELFKLFPRSLQKELEELTHQEVSEQLDLVSTDPELMERKNYILNNIIDIFEK